MGIQQNGLHDEILRKAYFLSCEVIHSSHSLDEQHPSNNILKSVTLTSVLRSNVAMPFKDRQTGKFRGVVAAWRNPLEAI